MTSEERIAFKRRATDAFLQVALRAALVRICELSGHEAEETLRQFERTFDRGLRTLSAPKGTELAAMVAAEDAYKILHHCVGQAKSTLFAAPDLKQAAA